ncbi:MAG: hypothetical protein Q9183_001435 [Haloplaca sp. 2 TL-2023]
MSSLFQYLLAPSARLTSYRAICSSCVQSADRQWLRRNASTAAKILDSEEPDWKNQDHTLKPLSRPIGVQHPPRPGENSGVDPRSWREKRDDFFNYDKHLVRREELTRKVSKPYFRDWNRTKYHRGKTFLSPPRLFRADKSLFFPNMVGATLASGSQPADTTSVLQDRVSIVSVYSGRWAELQAQTFGNDPQLAEYMSAEKGGPLQKVEINIEEDWMKAWIVRTFMGGIRKQRREEDWERYFLVTKGVTDQMREAMGVGNTKVGYVYLVDWMCRIRWAGSADAEATEKEGLIAGARRLVEAWRKEKEAKKVVNQEPVVEKIAARA